MWKYNDGAYRTKIGAMWKAHCDQIEKWKNDGEATLAYIGIVLTPLVLDLYGDRLERV